MTIQLDSPQFSTSKKVLEQALNSTPEKVMFYDPSIFTYMPQFNGTTAQRYGCFACVLDPQTRRRFAMIKYSDATKKWTVK